MLTLQSAWVSEPFLKAGERKHISLKETLKWTRRKVNDHSSHSLYLLSKQVARSRAKDETWGLGWDGDTWKLRTDIWMGFYGKCRKNNKDLLSARRYPRINSSQASEGRSYYSQSSTGSKRYFRSVSIPIIRLLELALDIYFSVGYLIECWLSDGRDYVSPSLCFPKSLTPCAALSSLSKDWDQSQRLRSKRHQNIQAATESTDWVVEKSSLGERTKAWKEA